MVTSIGWMEDCTGAIRLAGGLMLGCLPERIVSENRTIFSY